MIDFKKKLDKDLKEFKKLDIETKLYVVFFFIIIIIAAVVTGSTIPGNAQEVSTEIPPQTEEAQATKPTTTLSLSPSSANLKVGDELKVSVVLSKNPVPAADVVLTYDPSVFTLSQVENGVVFPKILSQKIEAGRLTVSTAVNPSSKDTRTGELFSFTLKAIAPSPASVVEFERDGTVTAQGGENILGLTVGGNYVVNE